jgi:hypothetical protein
VEQLAAWHDITVDGLLKAVSDYAEKTRHAAQVAISATFVERLYAAYAGLTNSTIEIPQKGRGRGSPGEVQVPSAIRRVGEKIDEREPRSYLPEPQR